MSGHSKWSQIKHKKGISDQKRSQLFSKLAKIIAIAARDGTDPAMNIKLQGAIERAREANMPKENIERAIKKAADKESINLKQIFIQVLGPAGSALIIEAITDNSNRTISEIKHLLSQNGAKIAAEGSLNWMFETKRTDEGLEFTPWISMTLDHPQDQELFNKLLLVLDDHDDVENIFTNIEP